MQRTTELLRKAGIIPVAVFQSLDDALPTAQAISRGGIQVLEVTLRTPIGIKAIEQISSHMDGMLVGAGTVLTLDQLKAAASAGAQFIVSPEFNPEIVDWCIAHDLAVIPGCVTPTEIGAALAHGLNVLKFFPAEVYGGISTLQALHGPYPHVSFVPTGGISEANLSQYARKPYIHAIGGGWLADPALIAKKDYTSITERCRRAVDILLGLKLAHVGINTQDESEAMSFAQILAQIFRQEVRVGAGTIFVGEDIELMKGMGIGENGHIAIATNHIDRAMYYFETRGLILERSSVRKKDGKTIAVYLKSTVGGFGIHLLQL